MNVLTDSPMDIRNKIFFYVAGRQLCDVRLVNKKIRDYIQKRESQLYKECTRCEFPYVFQSYDWVWPYRTDWKNIYVLAIQCLLAKVEVLRMKEAIEARKAFERIEPVIEIVEGAFAFMTISVNVVKISHFGWSASRAAIRAFIQANPHMTLREVYEALGIVAKTAAPLLT